jgi:hypothetical protein
MIATERGTNRLDESNTFVILNNMRRIAHFAYKNPQNTWEELDPHIRRHCEEKPESWGIVE